MHMIWICLLVFGALTANGLRAFLERWSLKCKDAGVEHDSAKDYKGFQDYTYCSQTSLNTTQFMEDTNEMIRKFKLTELDISTIKPTLQKYCSEANAFLNCTEILSTECLTEEENLRWTILRRFYRRFLDFFCENDANGMTEFINGNGVECGMTKELELNVCFEQFNHDFASAVLLSAAMGDVFILFATVPRAGILCNLIETAGNCITQVFQQCELYKTPAKLIMDLFTYIETDIKCAAVPKIDINLEKPIPKYFTTFRNGSTLESNLTVSRSKNAESYENEWS